MNDTAQEPQTEISNTQKRKLTVQLAYSLLGNELPQYYPQCFNKKALKPLKVGINDDIQAEHPELDERVISMALTIHCRHKLYLQAFTEGSHRINLLGEEITPVDAEEIEHSQILLQQMAEKIERDKQKKKTHRMRIKVDREKRAKKSADENKAQAKEQKAVDQVRKLKEEWENKAGESKPSHETKKPIIVTAKK